MIITFFSSILFSPELPEEDKPTPIYTHVCIQTCGCEAFVNTAEQGCDKKQIIVRRRRRKRSSGITGEEVSVKVIKAVEQIRMLEE